MTTKFIGDWVEKTPHILENLSWSGGVPLPLWLCPQPLLRVNGYSCCGLPARSGSYHRCSAAFAMIGFHTHWVTGTMRFNGSEVPWTLESTKCFNPKNGGTYSLSENQQVDYLKQGSVLGLCGGGVCGESEKRRYILITPFFFYKGRG